MSIHSSRNVSRRAVLSGGAALVLSKTPALGQDHDPGYGFILVGAGWCATCKSAAPLLAAFAARRSVPVLVASEDHRPIPPFPKVVPTDGHPIAGVVRRFPTTFVIVPSANEVAHVFEGYRSAHHYIQELEKGVRYAARRF